MNNDVMQGKWTQIKGEIRNMWGKLTDNELEQTKGNATAIAGLIQQRYGEAKDDVLTKINGFFEHKGEKIAQKSEDIKQSLRDETSNTTIKKSN